MYLHIGENKLLPFSKIAFIISYNKTTKAGNPVFLKQNYKEPVRSIIGSIDGSLYPSPINSKTLKMRMMEEL